MDIAATVSRHGFTIVTGNDEESWRPGLRVFNPLGKSAGQKTRRYARGRRLVE
jgi:hypothetical protein